MKRTVVALGLIGLMVLPVFAQDKQQVKEADRVKAAGDVISEIMNIPDDIPQSVIDKADCVVVLPSVLKAAFIFGGSYGRGVMSCRSGRNFHGPWSAPTMMALEGASFGLQLGGQATDFVLLLMSPKSAANILSSKVKIGGDASAAAGPVGRNASAETDITMRAEILSYSRARGLFAGVSLSGSTLRPDNDGNKNLYGKDVTAEAIVLRQGGSGAAFRGTVVAHLEQKVAQKPVEVIWPSLNTLTEVAGAFPATLSVEPPHLPCAHLKATLSRHPIPPAYPLVPQFDSPEHRVPALFDPPGGRSLTSEAVWASAPVA